MSDAAGEAPSDPADLVAAALAPETATAFDARVAEQADRLRAAIESGDYDAEGFALGMELEAYAVDGDGRLAPVPDSVFGDGVNKELGVHNVELNTDATPFDADGLASQLDQLRAAVERARERFRAADRELVLDAMWAVGPPGGAGTYLRATEPVDSRAVPTNMRADPRYVAIDADLRAAAGGDLSLSVPGVEQTFPGILFESLATSVQPHLQVPAVEQFPAYYNAAIRTLGPLLALTANSPFLPPDLYDEGVDPEWLVEATPHELRVPVFEQSVNYTARPKVRVPRDVASPVEVVDRVVADDLVAPFLREWLVEEPRADREAEHWEFDHKRSTYWRWVRCVAGGQPVAGDGRSLRVEYRPLPTQPTVRDVVGVQALTAGLLRGLVATDHPLTDLPWEAAETSFYNAVADGMRADLAWVTADGERTGDPDRIFDEVFAHARRGLREAGLPEDEIEFYLDPVEARRYAGLTPSGWQKRAVRDRLAEGADLETALAETAAEYRRLSRETESFAAWL